MAKSATLDNLSLYFCNDSHDGSDTMIDRQQLLMSIAATTADYRVNELGERKPEHVDAWVKQFNEGVQVPILQEMDHVLKKTYFSKRRIEAFLASLLTDANLVGENPASFWKNVAFLNRRGGGASQTEMLMLLDQILRLCFGFGVNDCGKSPIAHVYLDDVTCTGNRIRRDIERWVKHEAPEKTHLHIITIALHSGVYYANTQMRYAINESGKDISSKWWYATKLETQRRNKNISDVLWPTGTRNDPAVQQYAKLLKYEPTLRDPGNTGTLGIFSSEYTRTLLEQQFLAAGVRIRHQCPNLPQNARPLGYTTLETLGFGTLIVTYRNCPNNAPLTLWVSNPWNALFPRKTNTQTEINRMMEAFRR